MLLAIVGPARGFDDVIDFTVDIEPILKANCIDCHGPDDQNGELRLDQLASMLRGGNSGEPAIVPHKPEASFLVKLIKHSEAGLEMPPDDRLSDEEIHRIELWIASGAATAASYGPAVVTEPLTHWAFQSLHRSPQGKHIDDFVDERRTHSRLEASPIADRRTLIRRLHLVMLGLPPSPEQVEAFVQDRSEHAWSELVDCVLASPHYGERFASPWLDLARFGETNGFETNRERPTAWPYRDWVIRSLNEDKPYDEFVRQQIAGDVLGQPLGTGFLVAGPVDIVKGQDTKLRLMQRLNELDDIINTCGTAFLGLTTGCARCHNHKFDPISQTDYYAMQAVFAGVEYSDGSVPPSPALREQLETVDADIEALKQELAKFDVNHASHGKSSTTETSAELRPAVTATVNTELFTPHEAKFVRFTILATNASEPCIDELEIFCGPKNVALASAGCVATSSGNFEHPLHQLAHVNDGQYGNSRSWIASKASGDWVQIELAEPCRIDRIVWARDRQGNFGDRLATDYRIEIAVEPGRWETIASSEDRMPFQPAAPSTPRYAFDNFPNDEADRGRQALQQLEQLEARKTQLQSSLIAWIGRFSQPGPTHRLYRGEPEAPREQVAPNAISSLVSLDLPVDAPERERRLAFARWVTSPDNPLTARVIVNRLWQLHFGTGLVDTPSDFGRNGAAPTHPELLDFLASELRDSGWSLKHIHRLILNSSTWQQSNTPRDAALRVDAASRLLWRFPPRRLDAESIRDSILTVSGTLDLGHAGGPGFQPFEVEMENVRHYHPKQSYGPEDWRRMVYMTKVRQEKDHVFGAFDCPDASLVVPQRGRSTTPLQALNLLNSPFVMQQAELFAERLQRECPDPTSRVFTAWQLCFQRPPAHDEIVNSLQFITEHGLVQFTRILLNSNEFLFIP